MITIHESFEKLIDEIKGLSKYELGAARAWGTREERCGGPDPDGEYVELEDVICLIKRFARMEDD